MARTPLEIGTWGDIGAKQDPETGKWRAWASYRDTDGKTRPVNGYGTTENKAKADLRKKLANRQAPAKAAQDGRLTPDARFDKAIDKWIEELRSDELMSEQTVASYLRQIDKSEDVRADPNAIKIRPELGHFRIRELDVARFDEHLKRITALGQKRKATLQKTILTEVCDLCIRHKAMQAPNPLSAVSRRAMRKKAVKPKAAAWQELQELRAQVQAWGRGEAIPGTPGYTRGPRRNATLLLDAMDMAAATGARPHEVLAFRWQDIEWSVDESGQVGHVRLTVCGTIVQVKGKGVYRQEWTKTDAGFRSVLLPRWAVAVLAARWERVGRPEAGLIFPSAKGTPKSPNNFNRTWRAARGTKFAWVNLRTYRKTVATAVHDARGVAAAGEQLGHAPGSKVTAMHYIDRAALVSDNRDVLDAYLADSSPEST